MSRGRCRSGPGSPGGARRGSTSRAQRAVRVARRRPRAPAAHICSGARMPSRSRPADHARRAWWPHRASREARTSGSVGLQHRALLVEGGEGLRQVEEVGAQPVRLEAVADLRRPRRRSPAAPGPARARPARRATTGRRPRRAGRRCRPCGRSSGSARRRTAGRGRCCRAGRASGRSRRRSRCRARPTGRRTSPRRCRPRGRSTARASVGRARAGASATTARGPLDRLVEQRHQPQRRAAAGAQDLAVRAEDVADLHVHRPRRRRAASRPCGRSSKTICRCRPAARRRRRGSGRRAGRWTR